MSEHVPDTQDYLSACADLMQTGGADPEVARRWSQMVIVIADRVPARLKRKDILIDSLSVVAEVLRRAGHLETAREILAEAQKRLPRDWNPELEVPEPRSTTPPGCSRCAASWQV